MKVYIISLDEDYGDNEALVAVCETLDQANRWLDWLGGDSSNWKAEINRHINVYDLDLGALPISGENNYFSITLDKQNHWKIKKEVGFLGLHNGGVKHEPEIKNYPGKIVISLWAKTGKDALEIAQSIQPIWPKMLDDGVDFDSDLDLFKVTFPRDGQTTVHKQGGIVKLTGMKMASHIVPKLDVIYVYVWAINAEQAESLARKMLS